jgi:LDH2 family malate/lactate/ureidoglycolate dehydrogenase
VSVFDRWGTPRAIADLAADLMVRTDLRGVDSHGIGMLPTYQRWHRRGWIVPAAEPKVARDDATTAVIDGQQAFGHYTSTIAMELAIAKARAHGVGFVTCRNSNHYGAAANYSMMALAHDMIGLSMTNAGPAVVPTHGREAMLGTNPISFAAPAGRHFPFVLDMATSTVAIGKLNVALRWGKAIPPGWALDEEGRPTTDPTVAVTTRHLTPLGATRELGGHKGYGLAVMVDILSGVLAGAMFAETRPPRSRSGPIRHRSLLRRDRHRPLSRPCRLQDRHGRPPSGAERLAQGGGPGPDLRRRRARVGVRAGAASRRNPARPGLVSQLRELSAQAAVPFTLDA